MKVIFLICFSLIIFQSVYCPPPIKTSSHTETTASEGSTMKTTKPISDGAGGGTFTPQVSLFSTPVSSLPLTTSASSSKGFYVNK